MSEKWVVWCVFVAVGVPLFAPLLGSLSAQSLDDPGLVYLWSAERSTFDSQSEVRAMPVGNPGLIDGPRGRAFRLDGQEDYIDVGYLPSVAGTSSLTVMAWVLPARNPGSSIAGILGHWASTSREFNSFLLYEGQNAAHGMGAFFLQFDDGSIASISGKEPLRNGEWVHLAATWSSSGRLALYRNGVLESEIFKVGVGRALAGNEHFTAKIGAWGEPKTGERFHFHGAIDEVAVYEAELDAEEIRGLVSEEGRRQSFGDRSVSASLSLRRLYVGETVDLSVTVENLGPSTASPAELVVDIPDCFEIVNESESDPRRQSLGPQSVDFSRTYSWQLLATSIFKGQVGVRLEGASNDPISTNDSWHLNFAILDVESEEARPGGVFVTGHDPDFHAHRGGNREGAINLINRAVEFTSHGVESPRVLLVSDVRHPGGEEWQESDSRIGLDAAGQSYEVADYGSGSAGLVDLRNVVFEQYDVVLISSDSGGWLRQEEVDVLIDRSEELMTFVNKGGGLVALSEGTSAGRIGVHSRQFGFLPFLVHSRDLHQKEEGFTLTEFGRSLGLRSSDIVGNFSHNSFAVDSSQPWGLEIVDRDASGNVISLAARGFQVTPEGLLERDPGYVSEPDDPSMYCSEPIDVPSITVLGVEFPGGRSSFADSVVAYSPGSFVDDPHRDPRRALGVPESGGNLASRTVSLGNRGRLDLRFTDNVLVGSGDDRPDLWVFEAGAGSENLDVSISLDGVEWISVGRIEANTQGIDVDPFLREAGEEASEFSFVRLSDVGNDFFRGAYAGADVNAVGALTSRSPGFCLSVSPIEVEESIGTVSLSLPLAEAAPNEVVLEFSLAEQSALYRADVSIRDTTSVIRAGMTSTRFEIDIVDDSVCEPSETLRFLVDARSATHALQFPVVVTIIDDDFCDDPPVLSEVSTQLLLEDGPAEMLEFTYGDDRTPVEELRLSLTGLNSRLQIVDSTFSFSNGTGSVKLEPVTDAFGETEMSLAVEDGQGLSTEQSFRVILTPVNDAPTLDPIENIEVSSDAGAVRVELAGISSGAPNEADVLRVSASVEDRGIVTVAGIAYRSPSPNGGVLLNVNPDSSGTTNVMVTVDDGASENSSVSQTFTVTVLPSELPNTVPRIASILDQTVRVGESVSGVSIVVDDDETPIEDLIVDVVSLNKGRLGDDRLELVTGSDNGRELRISSLSRPTGAVPIRIRVTVTDEKGAAASTEFNLTVLNGLPVVEIVQPLDYAIIEISRGSESVDVSVNFVVRDDQPVDELGLELNGIDVDGEVGASEESDRFAGILRSMEVGEYSLRARAKDRATGEVVYSAVTSFKVVVGGAGEIAIVHPNVDGRAEVYTVWDYLVDLGHQPKVFLQEEISLEVLANYRAVIWHDLGSRDLRGETVDVFAELQSLVGTPIYFIGNRLASVGSQLSPERQVIWEDLTRMRSTGERISLTSVQMLPSALGIRNQIDGSFALLDEFDLSFETDRVEAELDAEILGAGGDDLPVVLRYPSSGVFGADEARRFVQLFTVAEDDLSTQGRPAGAVFERRVLFSNALCYLLEGPDECECPSAALDVVAIDSPVDARLTARVGEFFDVSLALSNRNGRCYLRQGQLTVPLPEGLELREVVGATEIPWEWDEEQRDVRLSIGVIAPPVDLDPITGLPEDPAAPEGLEVNLRLLSTRPGSYPIKIMREANLVDPQAFDLVLEIHGISLELQMGDGSGFDLVLRGSEVARGRIEETSDLGPSASWSLIRKVAFTAEEAELVIPVEYTGERRFFRVIED